MKRLAVVAALAAFLTVLGVALAQEQTTCSGVYVSPSEDLVAAANTNAAGTTFCIQDGTHNVTSEIPVEAGDVFWGVYSDSTRPVVKTTTAYHVFFLTKDSSGATIQGLEVSGAVGDDSCEPACGRGIGGRGPDLTVDDVRATGNANQGIGGTGAGLLVRNSMIDNNGSLSFAQDDPDEPVSAAGIKSVNSMTVINSTIRDNYWAGVWCDIECNAFEVHDSTITGNGKAGIHYEISSGPAVVEGNTIQDNGHALFPSTVLTRRSGMLIISSANADVYGNTFGGNNTDAVEVANDGRLPVVSNVKVHDNALNDDPLTGCDLSGGVVSCYDNNRTPDALLSPTYGDVLATCR